MSAAAVMGSSRTLRPAAAATLLAAAAGAVLGIAIAPDGTRPPAPAPVPRVGLSSGVAKLPLPAGWRPLERRSELRGLEAATAVRGVAAREVALDIRAPEGASLLPTGVATADLPAPTARRLGAHVAWRYELPGTPPGSRVIALTLPTTGGVVTIACEAGAEAVPIAGRECERAMASVQLDGASALAPAPEAATRIVLPATVARLNRRRSRGRRALAAARTPRARSAAALSLAQGYADASGALRPVAAGRAVLLTATLDALAGEHRALAAAGRRRDPRAARQAGKSIRRDEGRLAAQLAAITGP